MSQQRGRGSITVEIQKETKESKSDGKQAKKAEEPEVQYTGTSCVSAAELSRSEGKQPKDDAVKSSESTAEDLDTALKNFLETLAKQRDLTVDQVLEDLKATDTVKTIASTMVNKELQRFKTKESNVAPFLSQMGDAFNEVKKKISGLRNYCIYDDRWDVEYEVKDENEARDKLKEAEPGEQIFIMSDDGSLNEVWTKPEPEDADKFELDDNKVFVAEDHEVPGSYLGQGDHLKLPEEEEDGQIMTAYDKLQEQAENNEMLTDEQQEAELTRIKKKIKKILRDTKAKMLPEQQDVFRDILESQVKKQFQDYEDPDMLLQAIEEIVEGVTGNYEGNDLLFFHWENELEREWKLDYGDEVETFDEKGKPLKLTVLRIQTRDVGPQQTVCEVVGKCPKGIEHVVDMDGMVFRGESDDEDRGNFPPDGPGGAFAQNRELALRKKKEEIREKNSVMRGIRAWKRQYENYHAPDKVDPHVQVPVEEPDVAENKLFAMCYTNKFAALAQQAASGSSSGSKKRSVEEAGIAKEASSSSSRSKRKTCPPSLYNPRSGN